MARAWCGSLGLIGSSPSRGDGMTLVIRNTTIVTSDAARTVHHDGSIVVDADRIVAIGPAGEIDRAWPGAERVEGRGKAVFPGLVNCHTHLWLTVARGIQEIGRAHV